MLRRLARKGMQRVEKAIPPLGRALRYLHAFLMGRRIGARRPSGVRLDRIVYAGLRGRIIAGPFQGMKYLDASSGSALVPKLVGAYELEILPWIERLLARRYDCLVDVGAAEGYYAVGFAFRTRRNPMPIYAYDCNPEAQHLLRQLAKINGLTERITLKE